MPDFVYLLIDYPALILLPIAVLAALAAFSRSRTAWVAAGAWFVYIVYELGMHYRLICDECIKRREMYIVYPLLALLTLFAAVQIFVRLRERRRSR